MTLPHLSVRATVGVASLVLAVVGTRAAAATPGFPGDPHRWLTRFVRRLAADLRAGETTAGWIVFGVVAVTVTVCHFVGVRTELYHAIAWWDLLTHSLGGIGVAGLAYLTHRGREVAVGSVWWVVPSVFAIGAGFEVYEFLFKSFWHDLTLRTYAVDTAVDLIVNTSGAALVAVAVSAVESVDTADGAESVTDDERQIGPRDPDESVDT